MRLTSTLLRASQTLSQSEASRMVSEAAKRLSSRPPRSRWLRKHSDLIIVGVATLVAASALKRKTVHDEAQEEMELHIAQLREEKGALLERSAAKQQILLHGVLEGVAAARSRDGEEGLRSWIIKTLQESEMAEEKAVEKPKFI